MRANSSGGFPAMPGRSKLERAFTWITKKIEAPKRVPQSSWKTPDRIVKLRESLCRWIEDTQVKDALEHLMKDLYSFFAVCCFSVIVSLGLESYAYWLGAKRVEFQAVVFVSFQSFFFARANQKHDLPRSQILTSVLLLLAALVCVGSNFLDLCQNHHLYLMIMLWSIVNSFCMAKAYQELSASSTWPKPQNEDLRRILETGDLVEQARTSADIRQILQDCEEKDEHQMLKILAAPLALGLVLHFTWTQETHRTALCMDAGETPSSASASSSSISYCALHWKWLLTVCILFCEVSCVHVARLTFNTVTGVVLDKGVDHHKDWKCFVWSCFFIALAFAAVVVKFEEDNVGRLTLGTGILLMMFTVFSVAKLFRKMQDTQVLRKAADNIDFVVASAKKDQSSPNQDWGHRKGSGLPGEDLGLTRADSRLAVTAIRRSKAVALLRGTGTYRFACWASFIFSVVVGCTALVYQLSDPDYSCQTYGPEDKQAYQTIILFISSLVSVVNISPKAICNSAPTVLLYFVISLVCAYHTYHTFAEHSKTLKWPEWNVGTMHWLIFYAMIIFWSLLSAMCLSKLAKDRQNADRVERSEIRDIFKAFERSLIHSSLVLIGFPLALVLALLWTWTEHDNVLPPFLKGLITVSFVACGACTVHVVRVARDMASSAKKIQHSEVDDKDHIYPSTVILIFAASIGFAAWMVFKFVSGIRQVVLSAAGLFMVFSAIFLAKHKRDNREIEKLRASISST